jgi:hypothetical protein
MASKSWIISGPKKENVLFFSHLPFNARALDSVPQNEQNVNLLKGARSRIAFVVLAALGWIAGWAVWTSEVHQDWEDRMYFQLMELRPARPAPDTGLVHIPIEDMTDQPWPWPHLDYAILLHALAPYQPEVLALDLPLEHSDLLYPVYERQLARQMRAFRDVVLAARPSLMVLPTPAPPGLEPIPTRGFTGNLVTMGSARWPLESYWSNTRISPVAVTGSDEGRVPLVFQWGDGVVPAFALAIYGKSIGAYWPHCELYPGDSLILRDYQKSVLARIPVDNRGRMRLLPAKQVPLPKRVEFYTAILSAEQMHHDTTPLFDLNLIRRQVVLVTREHPDAAGPAAVPEGPATPGAITARTLQQLLLRTHANGLPAPVCLILILASAVLATWAGSLTRMAHYGGALAGAVFFLAVDTWLCLALLDLTLPLGSLLTALLTSWLLAFSWTALAGPALPDQPN